jgi:iron(III) transport system substrate-binding protein
VRTVLVLLAALCLAPAAGCGRSGGGDEAGARVTSPVVVYVASGDETFLPGLARDYEDDTGTALVVRRGAADTVLQDEIGKRADPPADVLVTRSVADIQRAAEHGALRPLAASGVELSGPAWLRDPDGFWAGFGGRIAVIVSDPRAVDVARGADYATPAQAGFENRLCLSSSGVPVNRAVIARLIAARGVRPAELIVRGWIANLARPVFGTEAQLLDALASGDCAMGIVSSAALPESRADLAVTAPVPAIADADAVGVGRHARNPDGAAAFIGWLLAREPERVPRQDSREAVLATWYFEDAQKLAERAHYP